MEASGKASRRMIFTICNLLYDEKQYLDLFKALITVGLLFTWILQSRLSIPEKWKAKQL